MSDEEEKVVSLAQARSKEKKEKQADGVEPAQGVVYEPDEPVYCSFCGRPNTMVVKMIKGPGVNICSECTMIAVQYFMLEDRIPSDEAKRILTALWSATDK